MKTSNYILITIFTLVVISTLTFFITSRQHENYRHPGTKPEIPLSGISGIKMIVGEDSTELNMRSGETVKLILIQDENIFDTLQIRITEGGAIICSYDSQIRLFPAKSRRD